MSQDTTNLNKFYKELIQVLEVSINKRLSYDLIDSYGKTQLL